MGDVADHSTCGYPFGLLSQSADTRWNRVQGEYYELHPGTNRTCWVLTLPEAGLLQMHDCHLVALEDPRLWPKAKDEWLEGELGTLVLVCQCRAVGGRRCYVLRRSRSASSLECGSARDGVRTRALCA